MVAIDGMAPKVISSTWPEKAKCVLEKATVVAPSNNHQMSEGERKSLEKQKTERYFEALLNWVFNEQTTRPEP